MKDSPKSPPRRTFNSFLAEGRRLNLLSDKRYRNLLRLMEHEWHTPEHEEEMLAMIQSKEREMLEIGAPCPIPTPEQALQGPILVGTTVDKEEGSPVGLSNLPVNSLAIGKQNTGKTRFVSRIIFGMNRDSRVLVFDNRHDLEFVFRYLPGGLHLNATHAPFNPFEPDPGLSFETNLGEFVNTQGQYLTLYHRGMNVLQTAAKSLKKREIAITAPRVLQFLRSNKKLFSHNYDAYNSAIDRLESLVEAFPGWNVEIGLKTPELLQHGFVYFDTSGIARTDLRISYIASVIKRVWLWQERNSKRQNRTEVLIVVDEAEFLFASNLSKGQYAGHFLQDLLRQSRAVGIQLILVVHEVKNLDHSVLANAGNLIAFRVTDLDDQRRVANSLGLHPNAAFVLGLLENRQCYVRFDRGYLQPFLMRTLEVNIDDRRLTHEEMAILEQRQASFLQFPRADELSERFPPTASNIGATKAMPESGSGSSHQPFPDHDTAGLLFSVDAHGFKGVTKVYDAAGLSPATGKKRLNKLFTQGLLGSHKIGLPGRSGQRTTAFLTGNGRELIGAKTPDGRGGDDHTAYQKEYHWGFRELGFDAEIEKTVEGKAVDVVVRRKGQDGQVLIDAVEFDLSTDPIENARQDLARGFSLIFLSVPRDRLARVTNRIKEDFAEDEQKRIRVMELKDLLREYVRATE